MAVLIGLTGQRISAQVSSGPRILLNQLVAYGTDSNSSLRSRAFLSLLTPRFRAAVRMDMAGDGIGVLDFDPICQCQNNDGLVMQVVSLRQNGSVATAKVNNRFGREVHVVRFRLSKTGSRWLLADVITRRQPSLLKDLEKANRYRKVR